MKRQHLLENLIPDPRDGEAVHAKMKFYSVLADLALKVPGYCKDTLRLPEIFIKPIQDLEKDITRLEAIASSDEMFVAVGFTEEGREYLESGKVVTELQPMPGCGDPQLQQVWNQWVYELFSNTADAFHKNPAGACLYFGINRDEGEILARARVGRRKEVIRKGHFFLRPRFALPRWFNPHSVFSELYRAEGTA